MKALSHSFYIGRLGLPLWLVGIALILLGVAAGQAVGPKMSGSPDGVTSLTIAQALTLDRTTGITDTSALVGLDPFADFLGVINDDGTSFMVAIETHVGRKNEFGLPLANRSSQPVAAILQMEVPEGVDVELDSDVAVEESIFIGRGWPRHQWLLVVDPAGGSIFVTVRPRGSSPPRYVRLTGRLLPDAG